MQYGVEASYVAAAQWLDLPGWTVEDWGCGCAHARRYFKNAKYIGIDGSQNDFADICREDITERNSNPDGILMRHVLEHNEGWKALLTNAVRCFKHRMAIVFFVDFGPVTRVFNRSTDPKYLGVPDIQFRREDIAEVLGETFSHAARAETDWILFCEKKDTLDKAPSGA